MAARFQVVKCRRHAYIVQPWSTHSQPFPKQKKKKQKNGSCLPSIRSVSSKSDMRILQKFIYSIWLSSALKSFDFTFSWNKIFNVHCKLGGGEWRTLRTQHAISTHINKRQTKRLLVNPISKTNWKTSLNCINQTYIKYNNTWCINANVNRKHVVAISSSAFIIIECKCATWRNTYV